METPSRDTYLPELCGDLPNSGVFDPESGPRMVTLAPQGPPYGSPKTRRTRNCRHVVEKACLISFSERTLSRFTSRAKGKAEEV